MPDVESAGAGAGTAGKSAEAMNRERAESPAPPVRDSRLRPRHGVSTPVRAGEGEELSRETAKNATKVEENRKKQATGNVARHSMARDTVGP